MFCGHETAMFPEAKHDCREATKHTAFPRLRSISVLLYTNYQRRTKTLRPLFLLATSRYLALFCFQIYAPPYCFSCSTIFILICDERTEVFLLQPRSSKFAKLNSLPVLLVPVHNILLPAERIVAGKQQNLFICT